MHISNLKLKALSAMVAVGMMAAAGAASAQTVRGAGATLPQPLYQDLFGLINPATKVVNGDWSYAGTGSGTGKSRFLTTTNNVNFAGSDSALVGGTGNEFETYNSTHRAAWGPLIQIPAVLTSVTLPFNRDGVSSLNLTREQVCKIFSYDASARNWGQITGNSADTEEIRVVYRSGSSGTTELLSRFLNAACGTYGKTFAVSSSFGTVVAPALPGGTIPTGVWVDADLSQGVVEEMKVDGSFGYVSPSFQFDPADSSVVASIDSALPSNISFPAGVNPPSAVGTARSNPLNWVPAYVLPTSTAIYPIYGTTNLLVGQCYLDGYASNKIGGAVKDFVDNLSSGNYDTQIALHKFVPLPPAWSTAIKQEFVTGNATRKLEIGNSDICTTGVGRPS